MLSLLLCSLLSAGPVKERPLYIRAQGTKVLKDPKASAKKLGELKVGAKVTWKGSAESDRTFHHVVSEPPAALDGYVLQSNLSPNPVAVEVQGSDGKPLSPQAFVTSGAATKAVSEGGKKYAAEKKKEDVLPKLEALEALSRDLKPAELRAHALNRGLPSTVSK